MTSSTKQNIKAGYNSSEQPTNHSKSAHFYPRQSKGSEHDWLRWRHLKLDKWGLMTGPCYFTSEIPLLYIFQAQKLKTQMTKWGEQCARAQCCSQLKSVGNRPHSCISAFQSLASLHAVLSLLFLLVLGLGIYLERTATMTGQSAPSTKPSS